MRLVLQTFAVLCDRLVRYAGARSHGRSAGAPPPLCRPAQTPLASRPCRAISTGTRGARARRAVKRRFFSVRHGRPSRSPERYISSASTIAPASVRYPPGRLFVLHACPLSALRLSPAITAAMRAFAFALTLAAGALASAVPRNVTARDGVQTITTCSVSGQVALTFDGARPGGFPALTWRLTGYLARDQMARMTSRPRSAPTSAAASARSS
jgi:hypothetical protein